MRLYSSGLATGFADTQTLPHTLQVNASAERTVGLSDGLRLSMRLTLLNVLDRINEIRSAEGIGIFQAAYRAAAHAAWNRDAALLNAFVRIEQRPPPGGADQDHEADGRAGADPDRSP